MSEGIKSCCSRFALRCLPLSCGLLAFGDIFSMQRRAHLSLSAETDVGYRPEGLACFVSLVGVLVSTARAFCINDVEAIAS